MKIYIVTAGYYSAYGIEAVLTHVPNKGIVVIHLFFCKF